MVTRSLPTGEELLAAPPPGTTDPSRVRVGVIVWALGMIGVIASAVYLPDLVTAFGDDPAELPWWLPFAAALQGSILLALAAAAGAGLAPKVGLHAPIVEAFASGRPAGVALRPQLLPGFVGAALGTALLLGLTAVAPDAISGLQDRFDPPLWLRVLYGGITEEILIRWGVMTAAVWVGWRFVQRRDGVPRPTVVWSAIVGSALLFGASHLPAAAGLTGALTLPVVVYVVLGNAVFGIVAGWLYWKKGLEAAVLAHLGTHVGVVALATVF